MLLLFIANVFKTSFGFFSSRVANGPFLIAAGIYVLSLSDAIRLVMSRMSPSLRFLFSKLSINTCTASPILSCPKLLKLSIGEDVSFNPTLVPTERLLILVRYFKFLVLLDNNLSFFNLAFIHNVEPDLDFLVDPPDNISSVCISAHWGMEYSLSLQRYVFIVLLQ